MNSTKMTYGAEEFSQRGQEIYDGLILPKLRDEEIDQFVAIDITSGNYEIHPNDFEATQRLLANHPDAQIWLTRAGQRAAYRIGGAFIAGERK